MTITEQYQTLKGEIKEWEQSRIKEELEKIGHIPEKIWQVHLNVFADNEDKAISYDEYEVVRVELCPAEPHIYNWKREPYIAPERKRINKGELEALKEYFEWYKVDGGELGFNLSQKNEWWVATSFRRYGDIKDSFCFAEEERDNKIEEKKEQYRREYQLKPGYIRCERCGRPVLENEAVRSNIIGRGRNQWGKAIVTKTPMVFCSGECAYNEQCAHEG